MKKSIFMKIAAAIAILFSLFTIAEGSQILLGITQQEYIVFTPLLVYNVVMAIVGLYVGALIWLNNSKALKATTILTSLHLIVLIVVVIIFISDGPVAMHSIKAMIVRSGIWLSVTLVTWKTEQLNEGV